MEVHPRQKRYRYQYEYGNAATVVVNLKWTTQPVASVILHEKEIPAANENGNAKGSPLNQNDIILL